MYGLSEIPSKQNTVIGDLKLTESLYNELNKLRSKFDDLEDALEKAQ